MNERFRRETRLMMLEQEADLLASMQIHALLKARRGEHNKLPTDVEKRDKRGRKYWGPADEPAKAPRQRKGGGDSSAAPSPEVRLNAEQREAMGRDPVAMLRHSKEVALLSHLANSFTSKAHLRMYAHHHGLDLPSRAMRPGASMEDLAEGILGAAQRQVDEGATRSTRRGELPAAAERAPRRSGPSPKQIIAHAVAEARRNPEFARQLVAALESGEAPATGRGRDERYVVDGFDTRSVSAIGVYRKEGEEALRDALDRVPTLKALQRVARQQGVQLPRSATSARATKQDVIDGIVAGVKDYVEVTEGAIAAGTVPASYDRKGDNASSSRHVVDGFDTRSVLAITVYRQEGEEALRDKLEDAPSVKALRGVAKASGVQLPRSATSTRATKQDVIDGIVAGVKHYISDTEGAIAAGS